MYKTFILFLNNFFSSQSIHISCFIVSWSFIFKSLYFFPFFSSRLVQAHYVTLFHLARLWWGLHCTISATSHWSSSLSATDSRVFSSAAVLSQLSLPLIVLAVADSALALVAHSLIHHSIGETRASMLNRCHIVSITSPLLPMNASCVEAN